MKKFIVKKIKKSKNSDFHSKKIKAIFLLALIGLVGIAVFKNITKTTSAQIVVDNSFSSYNVIVQDGILQGTAPDSSGSISANLEFYLSAGNFNLEKGAAFDKYIPSSHPHGFNNLYNYWTTDNPFGDYPYIGKNSTPRNETDAPIPQGVNDLQVHPPQTDQNLVIEFLIPFDGDYRINNLGIRDILPWGDTATFKVFNPNQIEIASLTSSGIDWVIDPSEYTLENLSEGDIIYFVTNRNGDYVGDSVKINWTIEKITIIPDGELVIETNTPSLHIVVDGNPQIGPYIVPAEGGDDVTVYAPSTQTTADGKTMHFVSWSNGGTQEQLVPRGQTSTLTAEYELVEEEPVFSNGFEEGDTSAYPQGNIDIVPGNTLEVKSVYPRTGDYSLEVASDGNGVVTQAVIDAIPAKTDTIYINTHISLDSSFNLSEGQYLNPIAIKNENYRRMMYISIDSDYRLHPILFDPAIEGYCEPDLCTDQGIHLGSFGPSLPRDGSWHAIQLRYSVDSEHGQVELWLDGERIANLFELNTGTAGQDDINVVTWGTFFSSHDIISKTYFDDLSIGHTFIKSEPTGGFENEDFSSDLFFPLYAVPTPDGRIFIALKDGTINVWENGSVLSEPLVILPNVNTFQDRGLLSIVLDPDFENNGYLYAAYTYDVNPSDFTGPKTARVVRLTVSGNSADLNSMEILLGSINGTPLNPSCNDFPLGADCIPSDGRTHTVGDMKFLNDGTLLVSTGDGASDLNVNDNAIRAQNLDSLAGKFLRITTSGEGVSDNPFYTGNPNSNRSKVWAYGFRNPFRFSLKPNSNTAFGGDVGWGAWEEINVIEPGKNYGWPCYEGSEFSPGYGPSYQTCQNLLSTGSTTAPLYTYPHPPGSAVVGGVFYTGTSYPDQYQNSYFFGDYARSKIWNLKVDGQNQLIGNIEEIEIEPDGPVHFFNGLNGDIYYISIYTGSIRRLNFTSGGLSPVVEMNGTPLSGSLPLEVQFSSSGTFDPDGNSQALTYNWDFGDGLSSIEDNPVHTYTYSGNFTVTLTVTDVQGRQAIKTVSVNAGLNEPVITIDSPLPDFEYNVGDTVNFSATAQDQEDGTLNAGNMSWELTLKHCETVTSTCHNHPFLSGNGDNGNFTAPDHGDGTSLILTFKATDSHGLVGTSSKEILPRKVDLNITSTPSGGAFVLNGVSYFAPAVVSVQSNADNSLSVASPQTIGSTEYEFESWSDGGSANRTINIDVNTSLELTLSDNQQEALPIFNSYNIEFNDEAPQLQVMDENSSLSAQIDLYLSGGNNNLVPGLSFNAFFNTAHPEGFNNLIPYWTTDNPFGHYPYAGKSTIARGENETSAPDPAGVYDLQVHPPSTDQYLILAFRVPEDGNYKVSNLAIKDILPWGGTATFKVFSPSENELSSLTSSGTEWVINSNTYELNSLSAGDKIHLAVSRDGDYVGDSVKIVWKIEKF